MLNEFGQEIPDPTPLAIPVGFKRPESLEEKMRRLIRSEALANYARMQGAETFEESNDFDIGDDYDPKSPWEYSADQEAADRETLSSRTPPQGTPGKSSPVGSGSPSQGLSGDSDGNRGAGGVAPQPQSSTQGVAQ